MLLKANSLIALNNSLGRLVGGPLGGLLLAAAGLRAVVVADAVSFAGAALLLSRVRGSGRGVAGTGDRRGRVGGALRIFRGKAPGHGRLGAVMGDARVRSGLLISFVAEIAQGIFLVLFIVFVAHRLHGGSGETGFLRGIQAVGAILGGLVVTSLAPALSPERLIAGAAALFGLISLTVWNAPSLTTAPALFAVLFMVVGAPGVVMQTGLISFLQGSGEDAQRGRIFGAFGLVSSAGETVGIAGAGLLAAPLGLMTLLEAQGLLYLLAAALAGWRLGRPPRARALATAPVR
jgi:predicted MFS family arabinose efflux permease